MNMATNIDGLQICCIDYENAPETKTFLSIKSDVVDLINRQQAEIERLQKNSKKVLETCSRVIKANDERNNEIFQGAIEVVRAEAIKEFARALRQQAFDRLYVSIDDIDNLVKEMVGEQE